MVKDTILYDTLEVAPDATEIQLKKAYRKLAIQYHPDKNRAPDAEFKFKEIGEAYQILSDPNTRAFYDKVGKNKMSESAGGEGGMEMQDPSALFSQLFGGERFQAWIGEISLVKDFATSMDAMMSDEEKAELAEENGTSATTGSTTNPAAPATEPLPDGGKSRPSTSTSDTSLSDDKLSHGHMTLHSSTPPPPVMGTDGEKQADIGEAARKNDKKNAKAKMTAEQREKLAALDAQKEKARKARINTLAKELTTYIRPFVDAKHPGEASDTETVAFEKKTRVEAEDLKFESFGVELLHTIGNVYLTKGANYVRSKKFFGGGFLGRLKEKGSMLKEGWGLLGSAVGVQMAMEEMAKIEAKGDASQEELDAMASDLSNRLLLTTWKGTRWEVISVVGDVVDQVLNEPGLNKATAMNRAKAIMTIGGIFKATIPDETDDERREIERLVLNAETKNKKKKEKEKESKKEKEKAGWFAGPSKKEPVSSDKQDKPEAGGL